MEFNDCRAFIFDMDGVLIDSETLYKTIEQALFNEVGVQISREEHIAYQGCSNPQMWSLIKEKHGVREPLDQLVEMTEVKVRNHFNSLAQIEPMTGVVELIHFLKKNGFRLALASSSTLDVIKIILAKTGLAEHFERIADSLEAGAGKPDPAIYFLALKKLGLQPGECIAIEDSAHGIQAALAAGMRCIAYNGPGSEDQNQSAAGWIIRDFQEITDKLKSLSPIIKAQNNLVKKTVDPRDSNE